MRSILDTAPLVAQWPYTGMIFLLPFPQKKLRRADEACVCQLRAMCSTIRGG
jgi:hypothetical protein